MGVVTLKRHLPVDVMTRVAGTLLPSWHEQLADDANPRPAAIALRHVLDTNTVQSNVAANGPQTMSQENGPCACPEWES